MRNNAKFNRDQVIENATNLYWEKGFNGTSMRNLQEVIDMRPGSIYAAFGSKEGLFKEVLNRYADMGIEALTQCRKESESPLIALKLFLKTVVIESKANAPSNMCMLVKTIAELTDEHADLLNETKQLLKKVEDKLVALLAEAQELGEIAQSKDVRKLARYMQVQTMGLRTYAKTCDDLELLETMIEDVFTANPF